MPTVQLVDTRKLQPVDQSASALPESINASTLLSWMQRHGLDTSSATPVHHLEPDSVPAPADVTSYDQLEPLFVVNPLVQWMKQDEQPGVLEIADAALLAVWVLFVPGSVRRRIHSSAL